MPSPYESDDTSLKTTWSNRLPWLALGVALVVSVALWVRQVRTGERGTAERFKSDALQIEKLIQARLQTYDDLLRGASEFVTAQKVDGALWQRYVQSLHLDRKYPTVAGLGYAVYLPKERMGRFLQRATDSQGKPITVYPKGERYDYFVAAQIEPLDRNKGLVGYDFGSELSARTAAERARDTNAAALTGKIILLDDTSHRAFLYFLPVFQGPTLDGWVFARFQEDELLKGIPTADLSDVTLQVFDGPAMTQEAIFYNNGAPLSAWQAPPTGSLSSVQSLTVGGRVWTLAMGAQSGYGVLSSKATPWGLPAVILVSLWAFATVWTLVWSRRRADVLARQITGALQQRETALASGPQGVITVDPNKPDWPITYANKSFERITGYSTVEVIGKNPRFLSGEDKDQKGLTELRRALREQRECRVLLRNYKKDGTPFWNDLTVTPVRNEMGRVVQFAGVQFDVSEREHALRRASTESAIIRALAESPSLQEAAPKILQAICESQEWDVGTLWSRDPRTNTLRCIDFWSQSDVETAEFERFNRDTTYAQDMGVPGHVWSRGEPVWLAEFAKEKGFPEAVMAGQIGLQSACGFPIANRRGLSGVLAFYSRRIWPLNKNLLLLMVGTGAQISQYMEREQVETQQKELTILERGLAEFMGEGLVAMDREGYCIYANAAAAKMLGYHMRTLLGQNLHDVLHPATISQGCQPSDCPVLLSLQSTQSVHHDEGQLFYRQDKSALPVAYTTSPIIDQNLIQGVVITFVDATQRHKREQALYEALQQKESEIQRIRQEMTAAPPSPSRSESDVLLEKIKQILSSK